MRYPASEKLEIIRLVEQSHLPVRRTLATLEGIEKMARANQSPNPHRPYWMLTLGLGMALTRAALDWGESALAELATLDLAPSTDNPADTKTCHPERPEA